jgi:hypothetical protein
LDNHAKLLFIVEIKIMKLNFLKRIFICALAAGLTAFATGKAAAGVVISGQLYTPVKISVVVTYYTSPGKLKKVTISNKDILLLVGAGKNNQLARGPNDDIFVIDKNSVLTDLTEDGYLSMNFNFGSGVYTQTPADDSLAFKFNEASVLDVNFYSDAGLDESGGHASDYWFETTGAYSGSGNASAIKGNQRTVSESFKSSAQSGTGFDVDTTNANPNNSAPQPVTGKVSGSGSGKVLVDE